MKIITVNLNPAYDIYYRVPGFRQYKENLAESVSVFTGGKGMNVSRALKTHGIGSTAYLLLGRENRRHIQTALRLTALTRGYSMHPEG